MLIDFNLPWHRWHIVQKALEALLANRGAEQLKIQAEAHGGGWRRLLEAK